MKSKGEIIRITRNYKKISLNLLEEISGVKAKKIGRFERGEGILSEKTISIIEKKLNVCLSEQLSIFEEIDQLFSQYVDSLYYYEDNDEYFIKKMNNLNKKNLLGLNEDKLEIISYIIKCRKNSQDKQNEEILLKLEMSEDKQILALYNLYRALEYKIDKPSKSLNYTNKVSFKLEN